MSAGIEIVDAAIDRVEPADARRQLLLRREKLRALRVHEMSREPMAPSIARLLVEVDAALDGLDRGDHGICVVCHDPVEGDRLAADPLLRHCLDHLTPAARRALDRDLELSGKIQRGLLPAPSFVLAQWDGQVHYEPHGVVGGDYCDVVPGESGSFHFFLGDVSGKGLAASMLVAHLHALFRSLVPFGLELPELVERANRIFIAGAKTERYATLLGGRVDASGTVEVVNAGHPAMLVVSDEGVSRQIGATGPPIGLFSEAAYEQTRLSVRPGQSLFAYTDGVTEAVGPDGRELGEQALRAGLSASSRGRAPVQKLLTDVLEQVTRHRGPAAPTDDVTILALQRQG